MRLTGSLGVSHGTRMHYNGPVVWGVAVRACPELREGSGLACVFARPTSVSRAGKVPISGRAFGVTMKLSSPSVWVYMAPKRVTA